MNHALQHEAEALGASLPPLLVQADHLAASVSLGVHGRRRTGSGESFWQFRRYQSQDAVTAIDEKAGAATLSTSCSVGRKSMLTGEATVLVPRRPVGVAA